MAALLTEQFEVSDQTYGMPRAALEAVAREISAGQPWVPDAGEITRHQEAVRAFLAVTNADLARGLWHLFRPAVLLISGLVLLALLVHALNSRGP